MNANLPAGVRRGGTDFSREMSAEMDLSLAAALREHAGRRARAEAIRYQVAMGFLGFVGGLVVVIPLILWAAPRHGSLFPGATADQTRTVSSQSVAANSAARPSLIGAPTIASRDEVQSSQSGGIGSASVTAGFADDEPVEFARDLIRSGDIAAARRVLDRPELRQSGKALFMLAETYDPNVLAALGATDVHADTATARRYYEAALAEGVSAASPRLEALE